MFWAGAEVISQLREGLFAQKIGEGLQKRTTNQGEVGEQVGVAGARAVFPHQYIASPMVADFDSPQCPRIKESHWSGVCSRGPALKRW